METKLFDTIREALEELDRDRVLENLSKALYEGIPPEDIISEALSKGMDTIGRRFDDGDLFLPHRPPPCDRRDGYGLRRYS